MDTPCHVMQVHSGTLVPFWPVLSFFGPYQQYDFGVTIIEFYINTEWEFRNGSAYLQLPYSITYLLVCLNSSQFFNLLLKLALVDAL